MSDQRTSEEWVKAHNYYELSGPARTAKVADAMWKAFIDTIALDQNRTVPRSERETRLRQVVMLFADQLGMDCVTRRKDSTDNEQEDA
jgi:hypothetical protein